MVDQAEFFRLIPKCSVISRSNDRCFDVSDPKRGCDPLRAGHHLVSDCEQLCDLPVPDFARSAGAGMVHVAVRIDPGPVADYLPFVTNMFLHGGWLHLILNMWSLWIFGAAVEDRLGPVP
jgi:hypothetical protein